MINFSRAKRLVLALALLTLAIEIARVSWFIQNINWPAPYDVLLWGILIVLIIVFFVLNLFNSHNSRPGPTTSKTTPEIVSPYIVGPAIQEPEYFFGRRGEVNRFFAYLNGPQPQPLQVLGVRRSGKTSFLRYISHPDVICKKADQPAKTLVVYIDLQADIKTVADFYMALGEGINRSLADNPLALPEQGFPTRRAFIRWLESPQLANQRLIILLDEFEALREEAGFDSDFFNLRSMAATGIGSL